MPEAFELHAEDAISEDLFSDLMRAPGRPLVVRGGAAHWECARLWTFDYFVKLYAHEPLPVLDCLRYPTRQVDTTVDEYLAYVQHPEGTRLQELAERYALAAPFYAYGCRPFGVHPELKAHWTMPGYVKDWCEALPPNLRARFYPHGEPWLLFSGTQARSILHRDDGSTIAWFAQLRGHKRFIVHPLSDDPWLYDGKVDPSQPDLERFPDYARATPTMFEIHPGDLCFLPPDWYHYVRTESPSITLTGNVVTHVNFGDYLRWAFKDRLPEFLGKLPTLDV